MNKCPDCGAAGRILDLSLHKRFCPAHTCDICGSTVSYIIPIQKREDSGDTRVCHECIEKGL
jgi:hypothetical protein